MTGKNEFEKKVGEMSLAQMLERSDKPENPIIDNSNLVADDRTVIMEDFISDYALWKESSTWKEYNKKGKLFADMSDVYLDFRNILQHYHKGDIKSLERVSDYRRIFGKSTLLVTPKIFYVNNPEDVKLIHHYGSNIPQLIKEVSIYVPRIHHIPIEQFLKFSEGVDFIKAFFDTAENEDSIVNTLEFISGKSSNNIFVTIEFDHYEPLKKSYVTSFDSQFSFMRYNNNEDFVLGYGQFDLSNSPTLTMRYNSPLGINKTESKGVEK